MDKNNLSRAQWFEEVILLTDRLYDEIQDVSRHIDEVSHVSEPEILTAHVDIHGVSFYFLGCKVACFSVAERLNPDRIAYRVRRAITRYAKVVSDLDQYSDYYKPVNPKTEWVDGIGITTIDTDIAYL